jgi:hypothetical protein
MNNQWHGITDVEDIDDLYGRVCGLPGYWLVSLRAWRYLIKHRAYDGRYVACIVFRERNMYRLYGRHVVIVPDLPVPIRFVVDERYTRRDDNE